MLSTAGSSELKRGAWRWIAAFLCSCALASTAVQGAEATRAENVSLDSLSVVKLRVHAVPDARSRQTVGVEREGTGIVIDSSGLVLTIGFLIQEADTIEIAAADGHMLPASVLGSDNATGLGLLRVVGKLPVRPIEIGDSDKMQLREPVLIVGFDGVAPALVVSRRSFVGTWEYLLDDAIYTAPATVNWQGAALINKEGKLVGVGSLLVGNAVGGRGQVAGNMFVPIDLLKPILGDLIAQSNSSNPRPWIGINTQDLQGKVIVTRVSPESPAAAAGLNAGDIIVGVRGEKLQGQADFYRKVWATGDAGAEVLLDVLQENEIRQLPVKSIDRNSYLRSRPVY